MTEFLHPRARETFIAKPSVEAAFRKLLDDNRLTHGWLLVGGDGVGKATLAYRIARALLDPSALADEHSLHIAPDARVFNLIAGQAHPDLFVAARQFDEKLGRFESDISVDTIRKLIAFLNKTPAFGGWRVAIVDSADDLNKNSANALLKALEEPPRQTTLLLLSKAPGALLATLRSRCRRFALPTARDAEIATFLRSEAKLDVESASRIAALSGGRPGYALRLAADDGAQMLEGLDAFLAAAARGRDAASAAGGFSGRVGEARFALFQTLLLARLSTEACAAVGARAAAPFALASSKAIADAHHDLSRFMARGEGLNADRSQIVSAVARRLRPILS